MVWSHACEQGGAMSNPFEYRELMRAHMRFNEERTVEQVLADQKARHDDRGSGKASRTPPEPGRSATKSELDAARALLAHGVIRAPVVGEVASVVDER